MQTPRWPRLWRRYSIANAPRDDGSLTLHVRAVAAASEPGARRDIVLYHGGAKAAWDDSDVYISGPDAMIVKTASALRTLGADPARLHYDLPDEDLPDES